MIHLLRLHTFIYLVLVLSSFFSRCESYYFSGRVDIYLLHGYDLNHLFQINPALICLKIELYNI